MKLSQFLPDVILAWCLAAPVAVYCRGWLPGVLQPPVAIFAAAPIVLFLLLTRRADTWLAALSLAALPAGLLLLASVRWPALLERPPVMATIQVTLVVVAALALLFYLGLRSFES
jgi:hypothetical protein